MHAHLRQTKDTARLCHLTGPLSTSQHTHTRADSGYQLKNLRHCNSVDCVRKDIWPVLTFSVWDYCTFNYSRIHCKDVFMLLEL